LNCPELKTRRSPRKNETEFGADGSPSAPKLTSCLTLSSLNYITMKPSLSFTPFSPSTELLDGVGQEPFLASPVVSVTVRDAASSLDAAFRGHFKQSPFHIEGSTQLLSTVRALLKAFNNPDTPPPQQKQSHPSCYVSSSSCLPADRTMDDCLCMHTPPISSSTVSFL
jgi:hypothetical protein